MPATVSEIFILEKMYYSYLQIRGVIEDNSKINFSYFSMKTYDSSLEQSHGDGSNDGSQKCFVEKYE